MPPIYLDHNATTPMLPSVRAAMFEAAERAWANPSSPHAPGRLARDRLERARAEVARLLSARPEEIVFTSGGTESDNLAVRGGARAMRERTGRHVLWTSPLEHPAVLASFDALRGEGFEVRLARVDGEGRIDPTALAVALDEHVALCSFALANHELGNLYPVAELAAAVHRVGAWLHCDAVQAAGKVPLDVGALGVDLLSVSSHKLHGPKGAGALWLRRGIEPLPLLVGGHQEKERRPGTENVLAAIGFGAACAHALRELPEQMERLGTLRDRLESAALAIPGARRFGCEPRVPNTANLGFSGVDGELLMMNLDLEGVAVSTGAACTSGSVDPSPVIRALGFVGAEARQAVRFSLGRDNTEQEIDAVAALLPALVERVRAA